MLPNVFEYFFKAHVTNEEIHRKIQEAKNMKKHLTVVMKQTLRWFGQV